MPDIHKVENIRLGTRYQGQQPLGITIDLEVWCCSRKLPTPEHFPVTLTIRCDTSAEDSDAVIECKRKFRRVRLRLHILF